MWLFLVLDPIDKFIRERSKAVPPGQEGSVRTGRALKVVTLNDVIRNESSSVCHNFDHNDQIFKSKRTVLTLN